MFTETVGPGASKQKDSLIILDQLRELADRSCSVADLVGERLEPITRNEESPNKEVPGHLAKAMPPYFEELGGRIRAINSHLDRIVNTINRCEI